MKRFSLVLVALAIAAPAFAQAQASGPAPPKNDKIAPSLENAANQLNTSTRHSDWADVKLPNGTVTKAWVVYPERADKAGVVIVIHDIYGMGDWPHAVADQLAKEGFIAIVPDLLWGKGPKGGGAEEIGAAGVRQAISTLGAAEMTVRVDAAMAFGKSLPASNGKTGVVGFCWGGNQSFVYAAAQPELAAAVVYYGIAPPGSGNPFVPDKAALTKIKAPVLAFYGGDDARVTATAEPTAAVMREIGKPFDPHVEAGAGHGFLRSQGGANGANLKASEDAWPLTVLFFKTHLK